MSRADAEFEKRKRVKRRAKEARRTARRVKSERIHAALMKDIEENKQS